MAERIPPHSRTPSCRNVVVLGSTGSIGASAIKVARDIPDRMNIVGLAAGSAVEMIARQMETLNVRHAALHDADAARELRRVTQHLGASVHGGQEGIIRLAQLPEADMVLIAIVGTAGLRPALAAIEAGKDIAVASKEILVMAGQVVMDAARTHGVRVLPVDSEHNAIFQCLEACRDPATIRRIVLTASGGPFREWPASELGSVTLEQALNHPTWNMGNKITIDSATLFNKGLEMIEARWLFDVDMARIDVVVHPQSIVHSMVEFVDGSILAQMSQSDMCFPIQYAVTYPDRVPNSLQSVDFTKLRRLDFEAPRADAFPALELARQAGESGGTLPAVLNASNEVAVSAFMEGKIPFPGIWQTVDSVMRAHEVNPAPEFEGILAADRWAREAALRHIEGSRSWS